MILQIESITAIYAPSKHEREDIYGSNPQDINEHVSVSRSIPTGIFAAMTCEGVFWNFPPKGINTVCAPTVESKRSESPRFEHTFKSERTSSILVLKSLCESLCVSFAGSFTIMFMCLSAPLLLMNSRDRFTISFPRHVMRIRPESFTRAITAAFTSSESANDFTRSTFSELTTIAMRS